MKKKYNFKKEHLEKLYKGGFISEKTAKAHGYAEGGIVDEVLSRATPVSGGTSVNPDYVPPVDPELTLDDVNTPAGVGETEPGWVEEWSAEPKAEEPGFFDKLRSAFNSPAGASAAMNGVNSVDPRIQSAREQGLRQQMLSGTKPEVMTEEGVGSTGAMQPASLNESGAVNLAGNGPRQPADMGIPAYDPGAATAGLNAGIAKAAGQIGYNKTLQAEANEIQRQLAEDNAKADAVFAQGEKYAQEALAQNPDPKMIREKFWDDKSTGQKLMAGIGLILGAFSPDGVNKAAGIIERQIDQNIKAQEMKSERLGRMADRSNTLYSQLRQKGLDKMQASLAMKDLMYKDVQMQLSKQASLTQNATALKNIELAQENINKARLENRSMFVQQAQQSRMMSGGGSQGQEYAKIMTLPENLRKEAFAELGKINGLRSNQARVGQIFQEMRDNQSVGNRIMSPIQSSKVADMAVAKLVPIAKSVLGEAMQEADVKRMVEPFVLTLSDSKETAKSKEQAFYDMLQGKAAENSPILSSAGILQAQKPKIKLNARAK